MPLRAHRVAPGARTPETARSGNRKRQTLKRQSPGYCGSRDSVVTGAIRRGPHTTNYPVPRLPSDTARLPRRDSASPRAGRTRPSPRLRRMALPYTMVTRPARRASAQRSFHATPSRCASIMSPAPNRRGVRPPTSCAHATMMRRSCSVFAPTPARPLITSALESRHVPHMPN
jgi:hypothetical protein